MIPSRYRDSTLAVSSTGSPARSEGPGSTGKGLPADWYMRFEGDPGAGGRFLKDHSQRLSGKMMMPDSVLCSYLVVGQVRISRIALP